VVVVVNAANVVIKIDVLVKDVAVRADAVPSVELYDSFSDFIPTI